MPQLRSAVKYIIILAVIAIAVVLTLPLLAPKIGNVFSPINSCLGCDTRLPQPTGGVTEPAVEPPAATEPPAPGDGGSETLAEIDMLLQQSMSGSLAYNAPGEMNIDETLTIELLLSPSQSEEELKKQISEPGAVLGSGDVKLTEQMEAKILSPDPEAFTIQGLQEPRQLISSVEPTRWAWYITARKPGRQTLTVAVYRVIQYQGELLPRLVKEYESDINVKVTAQSQLRSLWPLLLAMLLAAALIIGLVAASRRTRESSRAGAGRRGRKSLGNIFISYRRSDSADITGRIYDSLVAEFGRGPIFKDVDSIPLGVDFKQYLDQQVSECRVLLAIIGAEWTEARNAQGNRRLDDPDDFVRIEIESALERDIPVIPLLVRGGQMPAEEALPPSLQKLVYKNGMPVRPDPDFHHDMDRLIAALDKYI